MEYTQNYLIVLFKNKVKKKIINKFKTHNKANEFYKKLLKNSEKVIFPIGYENGIKSTYELALLERKNGPYNSLFTKDEFGRQVKIELDDSDFKIININPYYIEEEFVEYSTGKKINTSYFIKNYLSGDGFKLVSKLNNKIIVQIDDEFNLFTLKSIDDSDRFTDILTEKFKQQGKIDCLIVKDYSTSQRKYLYDVLIEQGFSKTYLQRHSTTHPSKK